MVDDLKKLKKLRESADYQLNYGSAATDIDGAIDDAEAIVTWLDRLPTTTNT